MRASHIFIVLFLIIPIVEIYFLIQVGSMIGAFPTILLILATAIVGAFLLRQQGLSTLSRFQNNLASGTLPAQELIEGIMLAVGGALLMTPGFFTDAIGFFCLIPFTRKAAAKYIMKRSSVKVQSSMGGFTNSSGSSAAYDENTYEGEFVRKESDRLHKD
ncbi:MAG TPA: FxsA family protein [Leucothrix mucor]|nr:FxsA family protein [Leucothrix mucor]